MNRQVAMKQDKSFYTDLDEDTGLYCVFGDNSGFAYASFFDEYQANEKVEEMINSRILRINTNGTH